MLHPAVGAAQIFNVSGRIGEDSMQQLASFSECAPAQTKPFLL